MENVANLVCKSMQSMMEWLVKELCFGVVDCHYPARCAASVAGVYCEGMDVAVADCNWT